MSYAVWNRSLFFCRQRPLQFTDRVSQGENNLIRLGENLAGYFRRS